MSQESNQAPGAEGPDLAWWLILCSCCFFIRRETSIVSIWHPTPGEFGMAPCDSHLLWLLLQSVQPLGFPSSFKTTAQSAISSLSVGSCYWKTSDWKQTQTLESLSLNTMNSQHTAWGTRNARILWWGLLLHLVQRRWGAEPLSKDTAVCSPVLWPHKVSTSLSRLSKEGQLPHLYEHLWTGCQSPPQRLPRDAQAQAMRGWQGLQTRNGMLRNWTNGMC